MCWQSPLCLRECWRDRRGNVVEFWQSSVKTGDSFSSQDGNNTVKGIYLIIARLDQSLSVRPYVLTILDPNPSGLYGDIVRRSDRSNVETEEEDGVHTDTHKSRGMSRRGYLRGNRSPLCVRFFGQQKELVTKWMHYRIACQNDNNLCVTINWAMIIITVCAWWEKEPSLTASRSFSSRKY